MIIEYNFVIKKSLYPIEVYFLFIKMLFSLNVKNWNKFK